MTNIYEFESQEKVSEGENSMSEAKVIRLSPEEFKAAVEAGLIGEAVPIEDEKKDSCSGLERSAGSGIQGQGAQPPKGCDSRVPDDKTIICDVARFVERFVFFQDPTYYALVACWIVATHLYKQFDYMGYLFVYSPEKGSGKSTFFELLSLLVYAATGLQISPTEAVMFRTAEGHTHLLDEVDSWKNKDDLRDVLNAGFKKGGIVTRFDKSKGGFKPIQFPIFAPRALSGIGVSVLHSTTLDRTFALPMVRQKKTEKRERARERRIGPEAKALKVKIENWVKQNEKIVADIYDKAEFACLESFGDRTIDIAEPLVAVLQAAYQGNSHMERATKDLVHAISVTRREQQSASSDHLLLKHLLTLSENEDPLVGNGKELAAQCGNLETPFNEYAVSGILRKYGFKTRSLRKDGDTPRYRFSLTRAALKEVVERWVGDQAAEISNEAVVDVVPSQQNQGQEATNLG